MNENFNLLDKVMRYYKFSANELKGLIIATLATAFIISFNDWGDTTFDFAVGFANFIQSIIIVAIAIFISQSAHRIYSLRFGYRVEFKPWYTGILIGVILAFVTRGNLWIILPGGFFLHHMASHRLGFFRYGTNVTAMSFIGLAGPLANIILATLIKTTEVWFGVPVSDIPFLNQLFFFNWAYALFNLLPIPPLAGANIIFHSRLTYSFIFGSVAGYFALLSIGIYSFVYAILIGIAVWALYYFIFERSWWDG